jgi:adenylate kinase family enzyme
MPLSYIFLLGRPGSGKSAVYRMLSERLHSEGVVSDAMRIDDFPVLKELLAHDTEFKRHHLKEGGFVVTNFTILDDVLKEINRKLKGLAQPGRIIFVEFARARYANALKNFDREVLDHSLILYIYCPFDLCVERNVRRFKEAKGKSVDDHIAPSDIMEKYYRYDDYEELYLRSEKVLREQTPAPVVVVRNDAEGINRLGREIEKVVKFLRDKPKLYNS